jgi:hypothetical protein
VGDQVSVAVLWFPVRVLAVILAANAKTHEHDAPSASRARPCTGSKRRRVTRSSSTRTGPQLTAPMVTGSAVFAATSGGTANVRLRFTELSGSARIDDIFVDPRMT